VNEGGVACSHNGEAPDLGGRTSPRCSSQKLELGKAAAIPSDPALMAHPTAKDGGQA
jgi:hypothetical protein